MSCAGNGYLTANELIPFPFEDGQCLAWECADKNVAQISLQKCFVDAGVVVRSQSMPEGEWPAIGSFSASGSSIGFTIFYNGHETRMSVSASGIKFPIVSGEAPWGSYVLVLSSEGIRQFCDFCDNYDVSPPSPGSSSPSGTDGDCFLRLCTRCVTLVPDSLSSIMVYDGVNERSEGPHFVLTGDIAVKPGNNMLLLDPDDAENAIELNAEPGAGMGIVRCGCSGATAAESSIASPDGHTRIFNGTCYDLEPCETTEIEVDGVKRRSRTLRIHSKCAACCTCGMYESIVNDRLAPLSAIIRGAKSSLDGLLAKYEDAVKRYNKRISQPEITDVTMSLAGMPVGGNLSPKLSGSNVKGKMDRCAFTAVVRNASFAEIDVKVNAMSGTDSIIEASASWSSEDGTPKSKTGDSSGAIVGSTFTLYQGRSLVITFVSVKNGMVTSVGTGGFTGSMSVGLSYRQNGKSGSLGTLKKTVSV